MCTVVFFAEAGLSVVTYLAANSKVANCDQLDTAAYDGSDPFHRSLGDVEADYEGVLGTPCDATTDGYHRQLGGNGGLGIDASLIAQVVPTTLLAMMIGNAITASTFYGLGKMKNTANVIGFIPSSVVAGFLTCIGYKVTCPCILPLFHIFMMHSRNMFFSQQFL